MGAAATEIFTLIDIYPFFTSQVAILPGDYR
jgi:hypothetical protein